LAVARAGESVHANPNLEFKLGEGLIGWIVEQRRPLRSGDAEHDPRFVRRPDMIARLGSFVGVPLVEAGQCIGVLSSWDPVENAFTAEHEQLLMLIAGMCAPHVEIARLHKLQQVDPLTGALSRRGYDQTFPEVVARDHAVRPLSVAVVDLDHFKRVNEAHGRPAGDEVLRRVTLLLASVLRGGDAVVRHGGEELLLILPGADLAQAKRVAERARAAVEARVLPVNGESLRVTVSIGVAERRGNEPRDALVERADAAMLAAKQAGRNRVETR
jgi:two-component system, cell cycle response regulator